MSKRMLKRLLLFALICSTLRAFAVGAGCEADTEAQQWRKSIEQRLAMGDNNNNNENKEGEELLLHKEAGYALYNRGVNSHTSGNSCCAVDFYLKAIEVFPNFPEACQNVALLFDTGYICAGKLEEL